MKSVTISFEYEENEYINADRRFLSMTGRINKYKVMIFAALIAICFACANTFGYNIPVILGFVLVIYWGIKMAFRYYIQPKSDFKKKAKNAKTFTFTFTKDAIDFATQRANAQFKWKMFKELYETSDMLYLAHANKSFTIIPKRAFEGEEQLAAFRKIVGQGNSLMRYSKID